MYTGNNSVIDTALTKEQTELKFYGRLYQEFDNFVKRTTHKIEEIASSVFTLDENIDINLNQHPRINNGLKITSRFFI